MALYFTSDMHYGHKNIIKYTKPPRPFANVDEMDQAMADRWRAKVKPDDEVYVVGDCSFYKDVGRTVALFASLPGRKSLVFGNHDERLREEQRFLDLFERTGDLMTVKVEDPDARSFGARDDVQRIVLCHYAFRVWNKSHFGAWHLYGHSHGSLADDPHALSLDVGVDCWDFAPVSYDEVKAKMKLKVFKPVDHHDRRRE